MRCGARLWTSARDPPSRRKGNRIQELGWLGSGGGISSVENPGWWTQQTDPAFSGEYVTGARRTPPA